MYIMVRIRSIEYGLYPRSEHVRLSISKWERNALDHKSLGKLMDAEKKEILKLFNQSGINFYTDPMINWQDILRMVASLSLDTPFEKISRYRETNTFYRQPLVESYPRMGEIREEESTPDSHLPGSMYVSDNSDHYMYFLPGIESIVNMSFLSPELNRDRVMDSFLEIYLDLIKKHRMKRILLFEPYPDSHFYEGNSDIFGSAQVFYVRYGLIDEPFSKSKDARPFSLIASNEKELVVAARQSEVPGIALMNAQNTYLENPEKLSKSATKMSSALKLDEIFVTHTEYFDFLPLVIANKKVGILGKVGE
jgi:5-methyltetrahydropteroyltriglutamate--homocysteine methyltransferase